MIYIVGAAVIAVVLVLRYWTIDGRVSPDSRYYMNACVGRPVPSPYRYRVLVPWVTRAIVAVTGFPVHYVMRGVVAVGSVACCVACYMLTLHLGGSPYAATAAVLVILATESLYGIWVMFPWLADPWAMAFAVFACCADPIAACVLLMFAALSKEGGWLLGSAWIVALEPSLFWVPIPGLATLILLRLVLRAAPPDQDWLLHPFSYSAAKKRRTWFSYRANLSAMKLSPFLALGLLPETGLVVPSAVVAAIAWLQTFYAVDHARLIGLCMVFIVPAVASVSPLWLLPIWVVVSLYWPFEVEYL